MRLAAFIAASTLLLGACDRPSAPAPTAGGGDWTAVIARHAHGAVTLADVVDRLAAIQQTRQTPDACAQAQTSATALRDCYRLLAGDLALEQILKQEDFQLPQELIEQRAMQARELAFNSYVRSYRTALDVDDAVLRSAFDADPDRFAIPASATLWNIYRRDSGTPGAAIAVLNDARQRFLDGETFAALAREYSQSENRLRGGMVGDVKLGGRLPERLEDIVFSLQPGEISDPVRVAGGAVLLHVSSSEPGLEPTFERARATLLAEQINELVRQHLADLAAEVSPNPEDVLMEGDALWTALQGDDDDVVLKTGDAEISVAQLRALLGLPAGSVEDAERPDNLQETYDSLANAALARQLIDVADRPEFDAARAAAAQALERNDGPQRVDAWFAAEVDRLLSDEPERLQEYFTRHADFYVTPTEYLLSELIVPLRPSANADAQRLEEVTARADDDLDAVLPDLAEELNGEWVDHGWVSIEAVATFTPPKARQLLSQSEPGQTLPVYQQDQALHLLYLQDERLPQPLSFAAAADEVRRDYLVRYGQDLYAELRENKLADADYRFDAAALDAALAPPEF